MSKRLLLCAGVLLALLLTSLPVSKAQSIPARNTFIPLSTYLDDPFAAASVVERIDSAKFGHAEDGHPILRSDKVWVEDEQVVFKLDFKTFELQAFAWNPWPAPTANLFGNFRFPDETRFPLFKLERGPDGKVVNREGLQVWTPQDLHLGMNTAFLSAHAARAAAETWAGREILWGKNGRLDIRPHFQSSARSRYPDLTLPGQCARCSGRRGRCRCGRSVTTRRSGRAPQRTPRGQCRGPHRQS